jgi:transposase
MGMGKRHRSTQDSLFIVTASLARSSSHEFYERLNQVLSADGFDDFVKDLCEPFYVKGKGHPSIPPGTYSRMLLVGYFEGLGSERGIDWRVSDSMALRPFLGYDLTESTPDHSTLSRIRQRLPLEVHEEVFSWILTVLAKADLLKGKTVAVDATTLCAVCNGVTPARRIRNISRRWPRLRASTRRRAPTWPSWTRSGQRRSPTTTGSTRTTRTPRSPG